MGSFETAEVEGGREAWVVAGQKNRKKFELLEKQADPTALWHTRTSPKQIIPFISVHISCALSSRILFECALNIFIQYPTSHYYYVNPSKPHLANFVIYTHTHTKHPHQIVSCNPPYAHPSKESDQHWQKSLHIIQDCAIKHRFKIYHFPYSYWISSSSHLIRWLHLLPPWVWFHCLLLQQPKCTDCLVNLVTQSSQMLAAWLQEKRSCWNPQRI